MLSAPRPGGKKSRSSSLIRTKPLRGRYSTRAVSTCVSLTRHAAGLEPLHPPLDRGRPVASRPIGNEVEGLSDLLR